MTEFFWIFVGALVGSYVGTFAARWAFSEIDRRRKQKYLDELANAAGPWLTSGESKHDET